MYKFFKGWSYRSADKSCLGCSAFESDVHGQMSFHYAASKFSTDVVRFFLEHGAEPDVVDAAGLTPLMHLQKWYKFNELKNKEGIWKEDALVASELLKSARLCKSSNFQPPSPAESQSRPPLDFKPEMATDGESCTVEQSENRKTCKLKPQVFHCGRRGDTPHSPSSGRRTKDMD